MSFGKNKSSSEQTFDPQLKNALMSVFNEGKNISRNTEYAPYNAATVAPLSPVQLAGMQGVVDAAQAGIGQNELRNAINTTVLSQILTHWPLVQTPLEWIELAREMLLQVSLRKRGLTLSHSSMRKMLALIE